MTAISPHQKQTLTPLRRRWLWRLTFILIVAGCLYLTRGRLLRSLASALINEDQLPDRGVVLILHGDRCFHEASRLYEEDVVNEILIFDKKPGRLERLGVLPRSMTVARRELERENVPTDKIDLLAPASDDVSLGKAISGWLERNPRTELIILCDAFSSRPLRWALERERPALDLKRLHVRPLRNRRYDEQNWWQTKEGASAFARGWITLVLPIVRGPQPVWRECDPEQFSAAVP